MRNSLKGLLQTIEQADRNQTFGGGKGEPQGIADKLRSIVDDQTKEFIKTAFISMKKKIESRYKIIEPRNSGLILIPAASRTSKNDIKYKKTQSLSPFF